MSAKTNNTGVRNDPTKNLSEPESALDVILGRIPSDDEKRIAAAYVVQCGLSQHSGKYIADIPPQILDVPFMRYQRNPMDNIQRVIRIANNWDDNKYHMPKVAYRDGNLLVVDGGHTVTAATYIGKQTIACEVMLDLTEAQEAEIFDTQDDNKVNVNWYYKYRSRLLREEPCAVQLDALCKKYSMVIAKKSERDVRRMTAIACAMKKLESKIYGHEFLDWVFGIMFEAGNWILTKESGVKTDNIEMFNDAWIEGRDNNCLDEYRARLVPALHDITPANLDTVAKQAHPNSERRAQLKQLCLDIARGHYVNTVPGHIDLPMSAGGNKPEID